MSEISELHFWTQYSFVYGDKNIHLDIFLAVAGQVG